MLWLFCKSYRTSLHVHHAIKTVFPWNIWKFSNFKKIFKNPDYALCLFSKCLQHSLKYMGWTEYRACCTAIVLTLHCSNILTIFKLNYLFSHFIWKILRHVLLVFNFRKMESTQSKMNRRTTTRRNIFAQPWQTKHLDWNECQLFLSQLI